MGLAQRWRTWAVRLTERHARRVERRSIGITLLERHLPVSLLHQSVHRHCPIAIAPRISVDVTLTSDAIRVVQRQNVEQAAMVERAPARVIVKRAPETAESAGEASMRSTLAKTWFTTRTELAAENLRVLRRSQTEHHSHMDTFTRLSTSQVAVEQSRLLRRRFQREELTLATVARQARQSVIKSAPAQQREDSFAPRPAESVRQWPSQSMGPVPSLDSITDHVIQQIDRKLVAHRERMGRI